MSDLPPPSSQQVHEPPFFHHPDGQRMHIFVEAGGILNRPRLIRKLKKHDANICTDPKNAQIILVDANSWQGKEFIREWGQDLNKVVLSYAWVTASENAGRPLLADDGWGACLTKDDGLPILKPTGMSDDREVGTTSLLPTPRETPVESDHTQSKRTKTPEIPSEKPPNHKHFPQVSTTASLHIDSYEGPAVQSLPQSQPHLLQQQQQSQAPSMPSPSTTDSTSMFASNIPFGIPNGAMSSFNMAMNMMPLPNNILSMFAQQQQQQPAVSPPMIPQAPSMMPNMPENFATALMDIMRMYGAAPGATSTGQWSGAVSQQSSQILPPPMAGSSTSGTIVREGSSGASLGGRNTESPKLPIKFYRPPSSSKRKRKSNGSPYSSTDDDDDGKGELPLEILTKKKRASTSKQQPEREERTARRTSLSFSAPGRNPHSKSSTSAPSTGSLFVNQDGKPMQFYVQVDLKGRNEVLRTIKKNGGSLTVDIGIADYAVLWSKSTTFKELLGNASAAQTPAVTYHFVLDTASQGSIPENLENYLFDAKQAVKSKRGVMSPAAAERRRIMQNARRAERRARERDLEYNFIARSKVQETSTPPISSTSTIETSSVKSLDRTSKEVEERKRSAATPVFQKPQIASASKSTPASSSSPARTAKKKSGYYPKEQTPPLPLRAEQHGSGRYLYTSDERDWMEKYAFILFKRNPSMNRTEVSKAFHNKLPHHPPRSIASLLSNSLDEQYNAAKKKGGIAHRKEKNKWEQEQQGGQQKVELVEQKEEKEEQCQHNVEHAMEDVKEAGREQDVEHAMEIVEESNREDNEEISPVQDPMDIDQSTYPTAESVEFPQEEKNGPSLTPVEEEDIKVFLQVFANGDDPELSEEQFFEKLGQVAACKSAPTWRKFNTRHEQQIMDRYSKQMDITHEIERQ